MLASLIALIVSTQSHAAKPEAPIAKTVCAKTVFASVDPKETDDLIHTFRSISSTPYQVDVVEKKEKYDVVRITHSWDLTKNGPRELVNPGFLKRTQKILDNYTPKNIWIELTAMKYCD